MERTKRKPTKRADLIITSDFHLRESPPICRTDDFFAAQTRKLVALSKLQKEHNCPVIHGGDLWDHWKPSPYLITYAIMHLPKEFWTIFGNHDLPSHSLDLVDKCGINTLEKVGRIKILSGTHWNQIPQEASFLIEDRKVLVWHVMTYQGKKPWPGCTDPESLRLLKKYSEYDIIITGHNHKPFIEEYENRILVNPGSLMRQSADQADFRPRVYLYYADTNEVEPVYLPLEDGVVSREHLERSEERSERINAFISKLDGEWQAGLSFEANLEEFFKHNRVRKQTKEIIYKAVES